MLLGTTHSLSLSLQVIVATADSEVPRLQALYDRGRQNNVKGLRLLDLKGLKEIEPYCQVQDGRVGAQTYAIMHIGVE